MSGTESEGVRTERPGVAGHSSLPVTEESLVAGEMVCHEKTSDII